MNYVINYFSGNKYYHDPISGETTWERPYDLTPSFNHPLAPPSQSISTPLNQNTAASSTEDYRYVASFNTKTGRFTSTSALGDGDAPASYWYDINTFNYL